MDQWLNIQAVEEFMSGYFAERAELRRSLFESRDIFLLECYSANYLAAEAGFLYPWNYEQSNPPFVESIRIKARRRLAIVTTTEPDFFKQVQCRYYLLASESGWLIDRKGSKCSRCDGKGYAISILAVVLERNNGLDYCSTCHGTGWPCGQSDAN